jgi:hypothetical protein
MYYYNFVPVVGGLFVCVSEGMFVISAPAAHPHEPGQTPSHVFCL